MLIIGSGLWRKLDKILKNGFLHLFRESKMKRFQLKIWHLKFSFSSFSKFTILAKISKKIMFYPFYWCLASVLSMVHSDCFIFNKVIRITVKVPSIRIALSIGSLIGKNCLSEGHPRFLSIFPFVNLRIKSIV